eukprot:127388-Prymnesium_polylepis.2
MGETPDAFKRRAGCQIRKCLMTSGCVCLQGASADVGAVVGDIATLESHDGAFADEHRAAHWRAAFAYGALHERQGRRKHINCACWVAAQHGLREEDLTTCDRETSP